MVKKEQIKTGDILLINAKNKNGKQTFLSKEICRWMRIYAKKKGIKYNWIGSHAATFIWLNGTLYVAESVDNGFHFREFDKHYSLLFDDYEIKQPVIPYTPEETCELIRYAMNLQTVNVSYQFHNFLQFPTYIVTGINLFGKGSRKITYCYESTEMIAEHVRPQCWPNGNNFTDFFKIGHNPNYVTYAENKIFN